MEGLEMKYSKIPVSFNFIFTHEYQILIIDHWKYIKSYIKFYLWHIYIFTNFPLKLVLFLILKKENDTLENVNKLFNYIKLPKIVIFCN